MKRLIRVILIFIVFFSFKSFLYAYEKEIIIDTFKTIIDDYNGNNKEIFNYIDLENSSLYKSFKNNIGKGHFTYSNKISVMEENNNFKIAALMDGSGKIYNSQWNIKNRYIYFTFKYDIEKEQYILIETDLFDATGINRLRSAYGDILSKALIISFIIFAMVLLIIYIVSKFVAKSKEKNAINT